MFGLSFPNWTTSSLRTGTPWSLCNVAVTLSCHISFKVRFTTPFILLDTNPPPKHWRGNVNFPKDLGGGVVVLVAYVIHPMRNYQPPSALSSLSLHRRTQTRASSLPTLCPDPQTKSLCLRLGAQLCPVHSPSQDHESLGGGGAGRDHPWFLTELCGGLAFAFL